MTDNGYHTHLRASPPARPHLAQPRLTLGMAQQSGTELSEEEQGRRDHSEHACPRQQLRDPGLRKPQQLLGIAKPFLNGMITNDKFCCTRWGILPLSWWRRPKRLRG